MNVLVVGGGGREHAITAALARSSKAPSLFAVMSKKNPGIARLCKDVLLTRETDIKQIITFAVSNRIDLAVIGPEAPLAVGMTDALEDAGIAVAAPRKVVAEIEFNKGWARNFMKNNGIAGCPRFEVFSTREAMDEFIDELGDVAIKPAGLTGGKGVKVMGDQLPDIQAAKEYAASLLATGSVVVEENLKGEEFTLQAFVDGKHLAFMPTVQDHKRAFEGDLGPNTGGMGSYTDAGELLPFLLENDVVVAKQIMKDTVKALATLTDVGYKGALYGQFMITRDGPKVIEFNARFGDPEAMNLLSLLKTDYLDVLLAIVNGKLDELDVQFNRKATVCKYAVPAGYPDKPSSDREVKVGDMGDALLFYSSVYEKDGKVYTTGSRAIAVVGVADTIAEAERIAQHALDNIKGDLHSRRDIGTAGLIQRRIDNMKQIRSRD